MRLSIAILLLSAGTLLVSGCATDDLTPSQRSPEVLAAEGLIVPQPTVKHSNDTLEVTGIVKREPGFDARIVGHIGIMVLDSDGYLFDELRASLKPSSIPATGQRLSNYRLVVKEPLPTGFSLRVSFVSDLRATTGPANMPMPAPMHAPSAAPQGPPPPPAAGPGPKVPDGAIKW
jgi:hypothetical protein